MGDPRVATEATFSFPGDGPELEARLREALSGEHLDAEPADGHSISFRGGSQLRVRLLGGWFVHERHLPRRGTLTWEIEGGQVTLELHFEETLGLGIMGPSLKERYEGLFKGSAKRIGSALGAAVP